GNPAVGRTPAARRMPVAGRSPAADRIQVVGRMPVADQPDNQAAARSPNPAAFAAGRVVRHGLHPVGGRGISQR
ncbi:hypothetical protein, partial [Mycobacterium sp. MUNTM1]